MRGSKRFVLLPPAAWQVLELYPYYHPRDRQSQLSAAQVERMAADGQCHQWPVLSVTVEPGELLFIPPYW